MFKDRLYVDKFLDIFEIRDFILVISYSVTSVSVCYGFRNLGMAPKDTVALFIKMRDMH